MPTTAKCITAAFLASYGLFLVFCLFYLQSADELQNEVQATSLLPSNRLNYMQGMDYHSYTVCNGMSNQILSHVGNIAYAITLQMPVLIPDAYIVDGAQDGKDDVTPSNRKYTPLSSVFDTNHLLQVIRLSGVDAQIIPYSERVHGSLRCSWISTLSMARPSVARKILQAFKGSSQVMELVSAVTQDSQNSSRAICVHHRNGEDWLKHCERWEGVRDGIWRKNCLSDGNQTLSAVVKKRVLPGDGLPPIFYVGDMLPPVELEDSGFEVFTRGRVCADKFGLRDSQIDILSASASGNNIGTLDLNGLLRIVSQSRKTCAEGFRDICAVIDFQVSVFSTLKSNLCAFCSVLQLTPPPSLQVCSSMSAFIGNSVSTWSALQIAQREGVATWYNSRSIPLADFYKVYPMPIIYTYTERSEGSGKAMLMASILSAKANIPSSIIHILYNGHSDADFRSWLGEVGVILHQHDPDWTSDVKNMFK